MNKFELEMLNKIDAKVQLTESELKSLVYGFEDDREEGEDRCWSRTNNSYIKLGKRHFCLIWEQGLTEMQENEFFNQPYEVEKKVYEKVIPEHKIVVTEWVET